MFQLIWAGLSTLLLPVFISDTSMAFSNSFASVLLFAALFILLHQAAKGSFDRRLKRFTGVLGFLFSLMTAFGFALKHVGAVPYLQPAFILAIALYTHIYAQGLRLLWAFLVRKESLLLSQPGHPAHTPNSAPARFMLMLLQRPLLLWGLLLLCWAPCYISTFPGNFVYDASYEYYQLSDGFTRSYPLLHSAIITRLFSLFEQLTGSINPGIACYTIVQLLLIAWLFSRILHALFEHGVHPMLLGVLTLYYALFPAIHLLVTCTTRDILFSALLTCTAYLFYLLGRDPAAFMSSRRRVLQLAAALVFTLLSRNNNSGPLVMILLVVVCLMIFIAFGRKFIRHSLLFAASALSMFCAINAVLIALCQPLYDSPPSSSMSMLAQPIVRAYTLHADSWPQEDREEFESYFTMETLEYFPQNADPAKGNLAIRYHNLRPFLKFWIRIGLRHPGCYMDAVLATSQQMWFPDAVVDGYVVRETNPYYEKNYFYFGRYIEEIGSRLNLLPAVFTFYENIGLRLSFEKVPLVSMLFSIGFQFWLLLHCVFFVIYKKSYGLLWPLMIILVYTVCSAFAPLVLLRYFCALFFVFPMTVVFTLCPSLARSESAKAL